MKADLIPRARFGYEVGYLKDLHCGECSEIEPKNGLLNPVHLEFKPPDRAVCPKCENEILQGRGDDVPARLKLYLVVTG